VSKIEYAFNFKELKMIEFFLCFWRCSPSGYKVIFVRVLQILGILMILFGILGICSFNAQRGANERKLEKKISIPFLGESGFFHR